MLVGFKRQCCVDVVGRCVWTGGCDRRQVRAGSVDVFPQPPCSSLHHIFFFLNSPHHHLPLELFRIGILRVHFISHFKFIVVQVPQSVPVVALPGHWSSHNRLRKDRCSNAHAVEEHGAWPDPMGLLARVRRPRCLGRSRIVASLIVNISVLVVQQECWSGRRKS